MPEKPPSSPWRQLRDRLRILASGRKRLFAFAKRNPVPVAIGTAAVLILIAVGAYAAYKALRRPPDVHNSDAAFAAKESKPKRKTVDWPLFGYNERRTRYLAAEGLKPPFKKLWKYGARPLLEFAPVVVGKRIYGVDNNGHVFALDADSGKVLWKRRVAQLNASSPTFSHHRLFVVNLVPGQILDIDPKNGRTIWKKELPGRTESAPVVVGNRLFFGDEDGNLYAVDRRNGHTIWSTQLCGSIKAAPAYEHGILYVGDYGGCMNAVNSHSGKIKWQTNSQGLGFGVSGQFYSTPAVAFGRVYTGSLDHRVYSFEAKDGTVAWSHSTGDYVYSGPTVADTPNTPPTVYIGSYDGNLYALDAKTGATRWSRSAGGPVIVSPSAVGNIVYVPTYSPKATTGFTLRNGRKVFSYGSGGANSPVISDGHRLYLTGYSSITALQPLTKKQIAGRAKNRRQKAARRKARQKARAEARKQHRKARAQAKKQSQKPEAKTKKGQQAGNGGKGP